MLLKIFFVRYLADKNIEITENHENCKTICNMF